MISFEAGVEALKRFIGRGGDEAGLPREGDRACGTDRLADALRSRPLET